MRPDGGRARVHSHDGHFRLHYVRDVPAFGWTVVDESNAENPELSASETRLENRFYTITLDKTGCLTSIYDKESKREVLTGRGNLLEAFDDHPRDCDN